tara:strand:+ start:96 stop:305 length:210 start_codon:yes stop_codon:yes gene_type:complete
MRLRILLIITLIYRALNNGINDKGGTAAYSPSVMLKIILFGYSRGFISSRRIANASETNINYVMLLIRP